MHLFKVILVEGLALRAAMRQGSARLQAMLRSALQAGVGGELC